MNYYSFQIESVYYHHHFNDFSAPYMGEMLREKSVRIFCILCFVALQVNAEEPAPVKVSPVTAPQVAPPSLPPPAESGTTPANPATDPTLGVTVTAPAGALVSPSELTTTPGPVSRNGASITTISKQEVQTAQDTNTAEVLRQTPGVTIGQAGRKGSTTSLYIRGGNNNQTEVLSDGFRVNRQGQGYDFDFQDPIGLERIEISRGMGSALYGSEALSGTVNIITQKGFGSPELTVSAAGGTMGTDRETILMTGACDKFSYNVSTSHYLRERASETNSRLEAYNYAARFDYDIDCNNSLKLVVRGKDLNRGFYESVSLATQVGTSVVPVDINDTLKAKDTLVGLEYMGENLSDLGDQSARGLLPFRA